MTYQIRNSKSLWKFTGNLSQSQKFILKERVSNTVHG